jgi:hypothetical protein
MKKLSASKIALHRETIRQLNASQLQDVVGGGSLYTGIPSCSTDGYACEGTRSRLSCDPRYCGDTVTTTDGCV